MKISVVIPNYNGRKLLEKNLPKVLRVVGDTDVLVVDDASSDDSVAMLHKKFPAVKVITKKLNEGFASTVNKGVEEAICELVLLLNTDVVPESDFLAFLIKYFSDPTVFAVGCLQKSEENGRMVLQGRGIGKFEKGFLIHAAGEIRIEKDGPVSFQERVGVRSTEVNTTLWVAGGAGLYRKSIWKKLGGMDSLYNPFYWEDIDISYRALKAGYKIIFESKSIVYHNRQSSSIKSNYSQEQIKTIVYRNQFFFVWLNITDSVYIINHLVFLPYHCIHAIINADFSFIASFFKALIRLPVVIQKRINNMRLAKLTDREVLRNFRM